ncbi:MAG: DUF2142 domain-containing protein [Deltaproteobacteria bacterium]|jgi:uncharacterized membrane protein|nr:DUF2142 domain-containing protein [Deltaproteobacteria bacterium]
MKVVRFIFENHHLKNFIKPHKIFLATGMFFGILFLLLTPPFQVPDEPSHFFRAWQVGHGIYFNKTLEAFIPENIVDLASKYLYKIRNKGEKLTLSEIENDLFYGESVNSNRLTIISSNASPYTPVQYIFSGMGLFFAEKFNLSALCAFYFGRFLNLAVWLGVITLGIYRLPALGWEAVFLTLLPMSIFQGMSLSADSFNNAVCFFLFFTIFRIYFNSNFNFYDFILATFLAAVAGFNKQIVILPFFLLAFTYNKFPSPRLFILYFVVSVVLIISASAWPLLNNFPGIPDSVLKEKMNNAFQHWYNPFFILAETTIVKLPGIARSFIGKLGWLDCILPLWTYILYFFGFFLILTILCRTDFKNLFHIRLTAVFILLLYYCVIVFTFYFLLDTEHQLVAAGIQGRYFLPISAIIYFIFSKYKFINSKFYSKLLSYNIYIYIYIYNYTNRINNFCINNI